MVTALERGDVSRSALKLYRKADRQQQGYLDFDNVHPFVAQVFQCHGLTPPLESHTRAFCLRFDPEEDWLTAQACLCLADAMIRMVLRGSLATRLGPQMPQSLPCSVFAPASTCAMCGEPFDADAKFCMVCGAKRPATATLPGTATSPAGMGPTKCPIQAPNVTAASCPCIRGEDPARNAGHVRPLSALPVLAHGASELTSKRLDSSRVKTSVAAAPAATSAPNVVPAWPQNHRGNGVGAVGPRLLA